MGIEFNENQVSSPGPRRRRVPNQAAGSHSGITGLLIKAGVAKNKKQAEYVQIGIIVVMLIIMFFSLRSLF